MKVSLQRRLFWFLKENAQFDLDNPIQLDHYIQQVFTKGKAEDIKRLFKLVEGENLRNSFERIKKFLPREIKNFWEEGFGDLKQSSK